MTNSRQKAIHQHCFDCIVDPANGNGSNREQTTNCTSYECKLYEFRPLNYVEKARRNDEKLKTMSKPERELYEANRAIKAAKLRRNFTNPVDSIGGNQ